MPHNRHAVVGWDIGGAHLKAAWIDAHGVLLDVMQLPCPLWQGVDKLHHAIRVVLARIDQPFVRHAITMTGELADIFPDRRTGVKQIAAAATEHLGMSAHFYAGPAGWVSGPAVERHAMNIASANWFASASLVASRFPNGLMVDIGSTTADLVPFADSKPDPRGFNDAERMRFDELVYTGVVRTPLMSLGPRIFFQGEWRSLAAEHFATTADVYRLTGDLDEADDMAATADGAEKTVSASMRRLARMIGNDAEDAQHSVWLALAQSFKQQQIDRLKDAISRHISHLPAVIQTPLVGAGAGSFLVRALARQLDRPYIDATEIIAAPTAVLRQCAAVCLPAYAVARLATGIASVQTAA